MMPRFTCVKSLAFGGIAAIASAVFTPAQIEAQSDTVPTVRDSAAKRPSVDSTSVQGSVYTRPFIASAARTAIGGYVEGNSNYFVEDGVTEGFSMELRRFNI